MEPFFAVSPYNLLLFVVRLHYHVRTNHNSTEMSLLKSLFCRGSAGVIVALSAGACLASGGQTDLTLSTRFVPPPESATYFGFTLNHRLNDVFSFGVRYGSASRRTTTRNGLDFTSGGSDVEVMGFYSWPDHPNFHVGFGVASPNVPDRKKMAVGTFDVGYKRVICSNLTAFGSVKGLLASDAITMGTFGFELDQGEGKTLFGSFGLPLYGYNARSLVNGRGIRTGIATLGLRFDCLRDEKNLRLEIAVTNQLGPTTGLSMTPSLGGSFGLQILAGYKF